jgi:hypothetical protein
MAINYNKPVFTIGREPLVAGVILARTNLRLRKQRERRRTWNKLIARFRQVRVRPGRKQFSARQLRTRV